MASLRKETDRGRTGWRLQFRQSGKRRSLWLGPMSKRVADAVARHVDELATAAEANVGASAESLNWASGVDDRIYQTLHRWGLVDARVAIDGDARMCKAFFEAWITNNCDTDRTENNYRQAVTWFEKQFGDKRTLSSITPAEFGEWHRWMIHPERLAESTGNKHAKRLRTLFKNAIKARLLTENPGSGTKLGGEVNRDRDHYVSRVDAAKVLESCDAEWALMFGLCRFAGLRCPSEVTRLMWSDIDWDAGRMRIDSRKTGLRFCPLWPELRPLLNAVWDTAPDGSHYLIGRHRDSESNLRTQLIRIIERAGLVPWPKGFVNLRASCRTDLEERFPSHVCDAWLGHSSKIAAKHYLQVTDAHWEKAITETDTARIPSSAVSGHRGGDTGGVSSADQDQSTGNRDGKKARKKPDLMTADASGQAYEYSGSNSLREESLCHAFEV